MRRNKEGEGQFVKFIGLGQVKQLVERHGIENLFRDLHEVLVEDFLRWNEFDKRPRDASHFKQGVIELMPTFKEPLYSFKYVNGHPTNTQEKKMCVVAFGCLANTQTGYPILLSEMTLLTAIRTASTAALSSLYCARQDSKTLAIIGTGAQSEFLALAHKTLLDLEEIRYFDVDPNAMNRFGNNIKPYSIEAAPCRSILEAVEGADIVITCTADKRRSRILNNGDVAEGTHIIGLGGDCPGKTELDKELLRHSKIVVEYLPQTRVEGEIQVFEPEEQNKLVHAELWELVSGLKKGRVNEGDITLFDSVGFAMEDFSVLRLVERLSERHDVGDAINLIPEGSDPKNLFGLLAG